MGILKIRWYSCIRHTRLWCLSFILIMVSSVLNFSLWRKLFWNYMKIPSSFTLSLPRVQSRQQTDFYSKRILSSNQKQPYSGISRKLDKHLNNKLGLAFKFIRTLISSLYQQLDTRQWRFKYNFSFLRV